MTDTLLGMLSLLVAGTSVALWIRAFERVAIPRNRALYIAAWIAAAMLGIRALLGEPGWLGGVPATLGTLASLFFLFTVAIGRQRIGAGAIRVGDPIPAFSALDEHGRPFDSQRLAGRPALIKFFRGHW